METADADVPLQEVEDGRLRLIHQDFLALQPDELLQALQHDADPSRVSAVHMS